MFERGDPKWKGLGLVYLDVIVMKEDERGVLWGHYKFAAVLKEALSPFWLRTNSYKTIDLHSLVIFCGIRTAYMLVMTR